MGLEVAYTLKSLIEEANIFNKPNAKTIKK